MLDVGSGSRELSEGAFLNAQRHKVEGGIDAFQAKFAVAIGVFEATWVVAAVPVFQRPVVVFHGGGGAAGAAGA